MNYIKIGTEDGISKFLAEFKGVKYFYVEPSLLYQDMQLYFSGIMAQVGLGIDAKILLQKLGEIEDMILSVDNATDFQKKKRDLIKITTNIESRVTQLIPTELLVTAASCVIFEEGSEFKLDLTKVKQRKQTILEDGEMTNFFTHFALTTLMHFNNSSQYTVQDYLQATALSEIMK